MTMPVRIYLSVLDGQFGTASALSTILLAATGLAGFVVFRISNRKDGAFVRPAGTRVINLGIAIDANVRIASSAAGPWPSRYWITIVLSDLPAQRRAT